MRVLIIEDSESCALLLKEWLQPVSRSVVIAPDMQTAIRELSGVSPFDIVTLDLSLPDSTPQQTLSRVMEIRALNPDCLLVVITGMAVQSSDALQSGADGFVDKSAAILHGKDSFISNLVDIGKSIAKVPTRYANNLALLENITDKLSKHCANPITP